LIALRFAGHGTSFAPIPVMATCHVPGPDRLTGAGLTATGRSSHWSLGTRTDPPDARTRRLRAMLGRIALIAAVILLGAVSHASAAVAVENAAEVGGAAVGTTVTIASFNPSFRSNLVLVVGLSFGGGAPGALTVTYGGVALALVPGTSRTSSDTFQHTELWYLVNPST